MGTQGNMAFIYHLRYWACIRCNGPKYAKRKEGRLSRLIRLHAVVRFVASRFDSVLYPLDVECVYVEAKPRGIWVVI